jgi:hypothetical protein
MVVGRTAAAIAAPSPAWLAAAAIVILEALLALAGVRSVAMSALALVAPGWALVPLLPARVLRERLAWLAAAPALGFAASSIVLITIARVGIPLSGVSVRVALLALVAVSLPLWEPHRARVVAPSQSELLTFAGLLAAVAVGVWLGTRVLGGNPIPGNDWAKYLLYADEIRNHGSLLIHNPFWMLGVPFREDPGVPALYGSVLLMSKASAGALSHGILVFSALQITTVFAFACAYWGRIAGLLAGALVTVAPAGQDILGWHGLANLAALAILALLLNARSRAGLALTLVGLAAAHRLTAIVAAGAIGLVFIATVAGADRRRALREAWQVAALAVLFGIGVLADLYARQKTFGGTLPYTAYMDTKIVGGPAVRDLSPVLTVATPLALGVAAVRYREDRALWPAVAALVVCGGLAYSWIVHIPGYYVRLLYFVPLAAAPLVAAVVVRLRLSPRVLAAVAAAALVFTAAGAYRQTDNVRSFYAFATPESLRGLDAVAATLRPNEVVVTDRCWSFLSTWLLHTRVLPALDPQDIQPKAELLFARRAQAILDGTPSGSADARRLGVRYLITDPTCRGPNGHLPQPPVNGTPVFASRSLSILLLNQGLAQLSPWLGLNRYAESTPPRVRAHASADRLRVRRPERRRRPVAQEGDLGTCRGPRCLAVPDLQGPRRRRLRDRPPMGPGGPEPTLESRRPQRRRLPLAGRARLRSPPGTGQRDQGLGPGHRRPEVGQRQSPEKLGSDKARRLRDIRRSCRAALSVSASVDGLGRAFA